MGPLTELEHRVHACILCKENDLKEVVKYYPIYSFGNPYGKELFIVGLNPSTWEYEDNYVSSSKDPEKRHNNQMNYFQQGYYGFFTKFENFFHGKAKTALNWVKTPWEKVGFTDLTKCPTRNENVSGARAHAVCFLYDSMNGFHIRILHMKRRAPYG